MKYTMDARNDKNSIECLNKGTCYPIGGYSQIGYIGQEGLHNNTLGLQIKNKNDAGYGEKAHQDPNIMIFTAIDSLSFFHQDAIGANGDMTSVAVLLEILQSFSEHAKKQVDPKPKIHFAFFQGESYSNVGSRKFFYDLKYFNCTFYDQHDDHRCLIPFLPNLNILKNFTNISTFIELKQLQAGNTFQDSNNLYLHTIDEFDDEIINTFLDNNDTEDIPTTFHIPHNYKNFTIPSSLKAIYPFLMNNSDFDFDAGLSLPMMGDPIKKLIY